MWGKIGHLSGKLRGSQQGQAMVELGLILIMVGPLLMALVVVYNLVDAMIVTQFELRHELRQEIDDAAEGPFRRIKVTKTARVDVPGRMDEFFFGDKTLEVEMSLVSYGGCYQGVSQSEFATFYPLRQIWTWEW